MKNTNKPAYVRIGNTIIVCKVNKPSKLKYRKAKFDIIRSLDHQIYSCKDEIIACLQEKIKNKDMQIGCYKTIIKTLGGNYHD